MRRTSLGEYLDSPIGKWVGGEGWLHFCATEPWLGGGVMWGHVDEPVIDVLLRCATAANAAVAEPHPALVDGSGVTSFDPGIFAVVAAYVAHHMNELGKVSQLAGVRPPGAGGALAEGFFRVVPAPYAVRVFDDRGEALRWLGREACASAIDEAESLAGVVGATSGILPALHRAIEGRLSDPNREATAKELGLSVRTMQRHLQVEGTSFQREVAIVRVRTAQRSMLDTNKSLAEVARSAGFSSPAKLSEAFKKIAGMTPKEWRNARR